MFFIPNKNTNPLECRGNWTAYMQYAYAGNANDTEYQDFIAKIGKNNEQNLGVNLTFSV